jgi:flagellar motor switch/type III secretory pathway protein FliN
MSDTLPHHPTSESPGCSHRSTAPGVEPLALASLPWVASADFDAARWGLARFGPSNRSRKLTLAPFGDLLLTFSPAVAATPPPPDAAIYQLRRGHERGWLILPGLSGLRLVATVLGIPAPRAQRSMGIAERGVLAAIIASILRFAPGTRVATSTRGEWSGSRMARIEVSATCTLVHEHGFIDVPPTWIPIGFDTDRLVGALLEQDLRIPCSMELARTTISAAAWSEAHPGDAVVFEERTWPTPGAASRLPVGLEVIVGSYVAAATCAPDGHVRLEEPFRIKRPRVRSTMAQDTTQRINGDVLASAPIEIVAELGRVALRADEVVALDTGSILTFGAVSPARVDLRVGDQRWATGELVNVEGQLGVRLLSVARGPDVANLPSPGNAETARR